MLFSVTKDNLQRGLQIVSHVSNKQMHLPILQNVHIKADGSGVTLSTTNLEMATRVHIRGKVEKQGEFTVPAKLFHDFVSLLSHDRVDAELSGAALNVSCSDTATSMNGIDASEFPLIPSVETHVKIRILGNTFKEALAQVIFSVSVNEARPELSGVLVKFNQSELILAATDSYRLSERVVPLEGDVMSRELIVPARAVHEMMRIISALKDDAEAGEYVEMNLSENQLVFRYGSAELTTRVIDGKYPDYRQIIPTKFRTEVVVGRQELMKAVKTASLFSRTGIFDVSLSVFADKGKVTVEATEATRGRNEASCVAEVKGQDNKITVNYRYLLDGLNAMESEGVTLKLIDGMNPCLVHPNGVSAEGMHTYLVMPIRQ